MAGVNLKLFQATWNAGMTDQNSLARAMQTKPDTVLPGIVFLFGYYNQKFGLSYVTQGRGNVITSKDDQFDWNVQGKTDKAISVVKVLTSGSLGLGGMLFKLRLKEKWFYLGDVLCGDSKIQAQVKEHPTQAPDGAGWDYTLKLVDPNPNLFIPASDVVVGQKFSRWYNGFEEFSRGGGSNTVSPIKLRNQCNILRMKKEISAHTRMHVAVFEFSNPKTGKRTSYWLDWEEWLFMANWWEMVERARWYSIYNVRPDGTIDMPGENGRPIRFGAGVVQQAQSGNSRSYTRLTTPIIDDVSADATFNMKDADNRHFIDFTGEMGFVEMHRALEKKAGFYTLVDSHFIAGNGQNLILQGQFTTYKGMNGVQWTLAPNPIFDNPDKNTKEHPVSRRPLESYRHLALDSSTYNGKSNLLGVVRESNGIDRSLMRWHIAGSVTPTEGAPGDFSSHSRASDVDGYELCLLAQIGTMLQNSTSCIDLYNDIA